MTPVSVIVVSRGRPRLLQRCLTGLAQLDYPAFEVIVVADAAGIAAVERGPWAETVKHIPFAEANISKARNAGLAQAAGEIAAFIDDDAVPEPTWLRYLTEPFAEGEQIASVGGYVRGRNGLTFQSKANLVDRFGWTSPTTPETAHNLPPGHAVKTEGTNCAFRTSIIKRLGGFDPAIRFFHDETDLDMRLREAGYEARFAPLAQVHHGAAASDRRTSDKAPRDLTEVGASTAIFWRKHARDDVGVKEAHVALLQAQRVQLLRHMVAGRIEPRDVARLLDTLKEGLKKGQSCAFHPMLPIETSPDFLPFQSFYPPGKTTLLSGRFWNRKKLHAQARNALRNGHRVTLFRFSPTALPHHVHFHEEGWWEHVGGLFGRSDRSQRYFRLSRFQARVSREWKDFENLRETAGLP